jgi:hypothetical protein
MRVLPRKIEAGDSISAFFEDLVVFLSIVNSTTTTYMASLPRPLQKLEPRYCRMAHVVGATNLREWFAIRTPLESFLDLGLRTGTPLPVRTRISSLSNSASLPHSYPAATGHSAKAIGRAPGKLGRPGWGTEVCKSTAPATSARWQYAVGGIETQAFLPLPATVCGPLSQ